MRETPVPPDQFTIVTQELRKLTLLVEEVERSVTIADNLNKYPATRALEKARTDIETAGYWLGQALKVLEHSP